MQPFGVKEEITTPHMPPGNNAPCKPASRLTCSPRISACRNTREPSFIVNEVDASELILAPFPHHKVSVITAGSCREAPNQHTRIPCHHQAVCQCLRSRNDSSKHVGFPDRTRQIVFAHAQGTTALFTECIEDRLGVNIVSAEHERLHGPPKWLRFPKSRQRSEGCVECGNAAAVESTTMETCTLTGQGRSVPLWIVRPINPPAKTHQAWPPTMVRSRYACTCSVRPSLTS